MNPAENPTSRDEESSKGIKQNKLSLPVYILVVFVVSWPFQFFILKGNSSEGIKNNGQEKNE
jgi:hypothetical protein